MAGDWIKVEKDTPNKPEILRLARLWGVDKNAAFGACVRFWMWLDSATVDGFVDGLASHEVDDLMHMPGFCGGMVAVGWLKVDDATPSIEVPHFGSHNGETAKKRVLSNRAQAKWRANVDAHVDAHVDGELSTNASTREEKEKSKRRSNTNTARRRATSLPPNFQISDRVRQWAADKGHLRLDERFEHFKGACRAKGYTYVDWDDAFMNAVRDDWAKFAGKQQSDRAATAAAIFGDNNGRPEDPRDISGEATRVA